MQNRSKQNGKNQAKIANANRWGCSVIKIVVPVSGGKDSQACLKLALGHYPANDVVGLFCDTGWEHPLTYQHIANMQRMYGVDIKTISAGRVIFTLISSRL